MNPANLMKVMSLKSKFEKTHPKFAAFIGAMFRSGITEGTIIEITVKKPGQDEITTNMKVCASDIELFEEIKNMAK